MHHCTLSGNDRYRHLSLFLKYAAYINKHVVEPGGTISPCGKFFQNLIGGGKFFLHYRGG